MPGERSSTVVVAKSGESIPRSGQQLSRRVRNPGRQEGHPFGAANLPVRRSRFAYGAVVRFARTKPLNETIYNRSAWS